MRTMRAAILERAGPVESAPLRIVDLPVPEPGPGEMLIRVRACGVCRTDLHVVEGELERRRDRVVPGHQVVGVVERHGPSASPSARAGAAAPPRHRVGDRVGVAWLHRTCGACRFCASDRENLCERASFTGWTVDGGFAEFIVAPDEFVYSIPDGFTDLAAAPLLCAGIIGFRSLRLTGLPRSTAAPPSSSPMPTHGSMPRRLGLYGFGAAGHVVIQLARHRDIEVFVATRDRERHQALAVELGAAWVGDAAELPPQRLDAAIIFAPAGELVPPALRALDKGGSLVLGGIHMSDIPSMPYALLYGERQVRSVENNTRTDGREFLAEAAAIPVRTHRRAFTLDQVNEALMALKHDAFRGAAVIDMAPSP